ncbi:MAG: WG repeat-containing protein, partial [Bacteroidota bacterium]
FLSIAKTHNLRKKAADLLYYIDDQKLDYYPTIADSLKRASSINNYSLFPALENGLFAFYNANGAEIIPPTFSTISDRYRCDVPEDDWLYLESNGAGTVTTKEGVEILTQVESYENLGDGIALVCRNGIRSVYHKSGFSLLENVENAEVAGAQFLKVKRNGKWGLYSFLGVQLLEHAFDDVYPLGNFWVFEKNERLAISVSEQFLPSTGKEEMEFIFKYDDVELVSADLILVFAEDEECMFGSSMKNLVPCGNHQIYPEESGYYLKTATGYKLYNDANKSVYDFEYPYVTSNKGWMTMRTSEDWILLPKSDRLIPSRSYDSVKLVNDFAALLFKGDTTRIMFQSGKTIDLKKDQLVANTPIRDDITIVSDQQVVSLFDATGSRLFRNTCDKAYLISDTLVVAVKDEKQGLFDLKGEELLPVKYDALTLKNDLTQTLINGKIGAYDPATGSLIPAKFEASLEKIGGLFLASSEGKLGVIDPGGKTVLDFQYDQINYWNDTSYLVKENDFFHLLTREGEKAFTAYQNVKRLVPDNTSDLYTFNIDGKFGLMSSSRGYILEPVYSDIVAIQNLDKLVLFADQHLAKAGYHVVSYMDENGALLLSKAYKSDTFEKVYCPD